MKKNKYILVDRKKFLKNLMDELYFTREIVEKHLDQSIVEPELVLTNVDEVAKVVAENSTWSEPKEEPKLPEKVYPALDIDTQDTLWALAKSLNEIISYLKEKEDE